MIWPNFALPPDVQVKNDTKLLRFVTTIPLASEEFDWTAQSGAVRRRQWGSNSGSV